jgi:hypothetical protein
MHALFTLEENDRLGPPDIMEIILSCLKEVKKSCTKYAIKTLSQLVAVSEYVKLHVQYQKHNMCKRLCLNVSIAIARHMGKGPYFARQI